MNKPLRKRSAWHRESLDHPSLPNFIQKIDAELAEPLGEIERQDVFVCPARHGRPATIELQLCRQWIVLEVDGYRPTVDAARYHHYPPVPLRQIRRWKWRDKTPAELERDTRDAAARGYHDMSDDECRNAAGLITDILECNPGALLRFIIEENRSLRVDAKGHAVHVAINKGDEIICLCLAIDGWVPFEAGKGWTPPPADKVGAGF